MSVIYRCQHLIRHADADLEHDVFMHVADGVVVDIAAAGDSSAHVNDVVDLPGVVIPGMIDGHSHLRSSVSIAQANLAVSTFEEWIYALTVLTPVPAGPDMRLAAHEMVASGITSAQIMVHSWGTKAERLDEFCQAVRAVEAAGLRSVIILGFTDRAEFAPEPRIADLAELSEAPRRMPVSEWGGFIHECADLVKTSPLVTLGVGPVAPQWCTDEALREIYSHSTNLRIHTHLNESRRQRTWLAGAGTPWERLCEAGLATRRLSIAHGVHLTDQEVRDLARQSVAIVHCAESNAKLRVGTADLGAWRNAAVTVGAGLDSQSLSPHDPFNGMRQAIQAQRIKRNALLAERTAFDMATRGSAIAAGLNAGELSPGRDADFVTLNLAFDGASDPVADIVQRASTAHVQEVYVAGNRVWPAAPAVIEQMDHIRTELTTEVDADAYERHERLTRMQPQLDVLARVSVGGGHDDSV